MNRSRIAIWALIVALVGSNAWWFYQSIDSRITARDRESSYRDNHEALAQALAVMPVVARPHATRAQVIEAALSATDIKDTFEKEGFVWVGSLGFKFDPSGRLVEVSPSWSPF